MTKEKQNDNMITRPKEWLPDKVAVLGAGRSGVAVIKFLAERGISVFISETCSVENLDFILASNSIADIQREAGGHTQKVLEYDLIICSPGIPSNSSVLKKAREAGIQVWSEIELAFRQSSAPYLAVTGSTGKSTTVGLLGAVLEAAGKEHVVAGNIGSPLINLAPEISENGMVVAEISSFQLECIDLFRPRVAAVLNFMKNHLDRYESEEEYYNAKKIIAQNMTKVDTVVLNARDERLVEWAQDLTGKVNVVFFGGESEYADCVWRSESRMYGRFNGNEEVIGDISAMKIKGEHNRDNACAAAAIANAVGIDKREIIDGVCAFEGLPHRLEFIREINGVSYYNDSKATTAESVACAISAFDAQVHLIAGGKDKGCDFSGIRDSIEQKVKSVCLIGEAAGRMSKEWKGLTEINKAESLKKALEIINTNALPGDVVILSPGCSSFDMFSNFEDRGSVFKRLVDELPEEGSYTND